MNKSVKRIAKGLIVIVPLCYFFPKFMAFYIVCGLYDVSRNTNLSYEVFEKYFFGNGILTWLLSPFNILMDILSLPFINKGVYKLEDLPREHQAEIRQLIDAAHREDLVGKLQAVAKDQQRSMFFFKWYGNNAETIVDVPAFHQKYKYIKTIGVSVFNKKASTSKHFGPVRATLRVLYNINDMEDRSAYIVVGKNVSYWKDDKMFIFDDTLLHQSFNESDKIRYCLFIDIVRPTKIPAVLAAIVGGISKLAAAGANSIFYNNWKVFQK